MKIWRTSEIEELLQSASYALQDYRENEVTPGDEAVELFGCLVDSLQGILLHEQEVM